MLNLMLTLWGRRLYLSVSANLGMRSNNEYFTHYNFKSGVSNSDRKTGQFFVNLFPRCSNRDELEMRLNKKLF